MKRLSFQLQIDQSFKVNPIVAILGPRQCGKTTLARNYIKTKKMRSKLNYFDLENFTDLERIQKPELTLSQLEGLITIDEIQRVPELFATLRVMVDRPKNKARFLILGSASRQLIQQSSESLAGRISYIELTPFDSTEVKKLDRLWLRGGFPRSYLSKNEEISHQWRMDYIRTFLEQDIPNLGIQIAPPNLHRFWMMLAHYHGNICNYSEIGRSLNLSHKTVQHYLDILTGTFMLRQLPPWFENIKKRQVKSPKLYFRDSGLLHTLLGIKSKSDLVTHPKLGASWEGFALEEIARRLCVDLNKCYFWATHSHAELDFFVIKNGKRIGFEIKYTDKPKLTLSMRSAMENLKLDQLHLIYPGKARFLLDRKIEAIGLTVFLEKR
jgi:predicted AAA+ superfamily ATPase